MNQTIGLLILLVAGIFQGSFVLPMTLTKNWNWENTWFAFSLFGMVTLNLALAALFIPHLFSVYAALPETDLLLLTVFGLGWGIGAVLFGIAMNKLGMAIGYPVIMGLIASFGAVIPMLVFHTSEVLTAKGIALLFGSVVVIAGIVLCAKAHALKKSSPQNKVNNSRSGIFVAITAGILSCLPNVGFSFGASLVEEASKAGASNFMAGNAVWALFFTTGFIPNAIYTFYLLKKNKTLHLFKASAGHNLFLALLMAGMWIGSFYLYGISTINLGAWGTIIGWPLFIALSIIIGNFWGIANKEWKGESQQATTKLRQGLGVIFLAVVIIGLCNLL